MSYQVLARKWRPRHFKEMVGQESILRILTNALEHKRLHHAYLFTGTRGVGKTTLARIIAKCLNCEVGVTANPCGTCHACTAIDAGQFLDLYEVDAASRTKVEDTRELLDNVLYQPVQGRYKIYLIDEVHMLSTHSFNALLKTLEEPPAHVKFLLATTDPKRLPITILSRCLQFRLKHISAAQIAGHLEHICRIEQIIYELQALERLAKAADGSMRDAQSLLDQAIAYGNGTLTYAEVNTMLGGMTQDELTPFLEALAKKSGRILWQCMEQLAETAPDYEAAFKELINLLHRVTLIQLIPDLAETDKLKQLAEQFKPEEMQLYYQIALLGYRDLAYAPSALQAFEMTLLRMLAFKPLLSSHEIELPLDEPKLAANSSFPPSITSEIATIQAPLCSEWREILPHLGLSGLSYALASNCQLHQQSENSMQLILSTTHQPMLNDKLKERIGEALSRYLKKPIQLSIELSDAPLTTPMKTLQQEQETTLAKANKTVSNHPAIKKLIEMYDATVETAFIS